MLAIFTLWTQKLKMMKLNICKSALFIFLLLRRKKQFLDHEVNLSIWSQNKIWKTSYNHIPSQYMVVITLGAKNSPFNKTINKTNNQSFSTFYSIKFKQMKTYNALSGKWPFVLSCVVFWQSTSGARNVLAGSFCTHQNASLVDQWPN